MRTFNLLLTGFALVSATAATAQAPAAQITQGATVYDTAGAALGTIASVDGTDAIIDTGANKLAIPLASFGAGASGPVLAATKAQLDGAAVEAATAAKTALMAKLVPGTEVRGQAGNTVVGSIKSVSGDLVLVATPDGEVNVPAMSFKAGPTGVLVQMSAEEFSNAVAATKG